MLETQQEAELKCYQRRYQLLRNEVDEINESATTTRKQLWETQDKLSDSLKKNRQLENHLNEVLELRENDIETIKMLQKKNTECFENEHRARESMEIFKKVYKRAQLKIKDNEEEIAILREQRDAVIRDKNRKRGEATAVDELDALKRIKLLSKKKEKAMKDLLIQAERDVEIWKRRFSIEANRVKGCKEQLLAMDDPYRCASYIEKQHLVIADLESQLSALQDKVEDEDDREVESEDKDRDGHGDAMGYKRYDRLDNGIIHRAYFDEDLEEGCTREIKKLFSSTTDLCISKIGSKLH